MSLYTDRLKEIADVIRSKRHTTEEIPATSFAQEISKIDLGLTTRSEMNEDGTQTLHIVRVTESTPPSFNDASGVNFKKIHCYLEENERGFYTLHMEDYTDQTEDNYMVGYVPEGNYFQLYLVEV